MEGARRGAPAGLHTAIPEVPRAAARRRRLHQGRGEVAPDQEENPFLKKHPSPELRFETEAWFSPRDKLFILQ